MIKVSVHNNKDNRDFGAKFPSQELADAWIAEQREQQSWGKVERWLPEDALDNNNIIDSIANELRGDEPIEGNPDLRKTWYKFSDDFTITQEDISSEIEQQNILQYAQKAQALGAEILSDVFVMNQSKALTSIQFDNILNDATLAKIERCLWQGSLVKAKELIMTLDESFFTTSEKNSIIAKIDAFIG